MTIEKSSTGTTMELKLAGWLDTQSSSELEEELNALPADILALVMDCSELEYISSAGLRQFVAAHKKMNGEFTVKNASSEIMNVIKMTGLDKRMRFE